MTITVSPNPFNKTTQSSIVWTDTNYTFNDESYYNLYIIIDGNLNYVSGLTGNNSNSITFTGIDLNVYDNGLYILNLEAQGGTADYNQNFNSFEINSLTISVSPNPFDKLNPTDLTWTDTTYTFINNEFYNLNLIINDMPTSISSSSGNGSNTIIFTEIDLNSYINGTYTLNVNTSSEITTYNQSFNQFNISCFVEGTNILCENNENVKIENLKIGDYVKTYNHGYKKIKYIMNRKTKNDKSIHQIHKIKTNQEDLYMTGGHSLLVDSLTEQEKQDTIKIWNELKMIDDKYLLLAFVVSNPELVSKVDDNLEYNLYHIVLENDDLDGQYGIYSNGLITETMSINYYKNNYNRGMFSII
jgi:hypothetical protein